MATFVIVHGAWSGGWAWGDVARALRAAGHEAFTPTLSGLGERVHLASPAIDLDTHVLDVVNLLRYERLERVVLVGHSYGGMVISGVAERVPEWIDRLVYLDAFVPRDGESAEAIAGPGLAGAINEAARIHGDGWWVPFLGEPIDPERATVMPLGPLRSPITLRDAGARRLLRTFFRFTAKPPDDPQAPIFDAMAARVKAEDGWTYREVAFDHSPQFTRPREVAQLLLEVV